MLPATEYARAESVLGAGLASVMRLPPDRESQVALHRACLRRVLDAEESGKVDAARAFLLGNLVETYLPLSDAEREALRLQLEQEGDTTMEATELTWADQIDLRVSIRVKRDYIRRVLQRRFGQVSPQLESTIAATETEEDLDALLDRAAVARTEDELYGSQSG